MRIPAEELKKTS